VKIAGEMVAEPVGGIFADVLALIFGGVIAEAASRLVGEVIAEEFEFAKLLELIGSGELSVGAVLNVASPDETVNGGWANEDTDT
jgi:hypothetical protein